MFGQIFFFRPRFCTAAYIKMTSYSDAFRSLAYFVKGKNTVLLRIFLRGRCCFWYAYHNPGIMLALISENCQTIKSLLRALKGLLSAAKCFSL